MAPGASCGPLEPPMYSMVRLLFPLVSCSSSVLLRHLVEVSYYIYHDVPTQTRCFQTFEVAPGPL